MNGTMRQQIKLSGVSRELEGQEWQGVNLVRIGRDPYAEVRLGDTSISRCHAELSYVKPLGWFLRDRGSTNGTFLNGVRIASDDRQVQPKDLIQVGNLVMRVIRMDQADSPALEGFYGAMRVDAATQHGCEQAFEVVAHNMAQHSCTGAQLVGLLRAGQALHQHHSLDELLGKSLDDALRVLDARSGALLLFDESAGVLALQASASGANKSSNAPCFSSTLTRRCFSRGESLLCQDVVDDVELRGAESVARGNMRSVICALVRSPKKRWGVLQLSRGRQDKPFAVFELHLADAIAANIAGSIESAKFFQAKQRSWFIKTVVTLAQTIELRDPSTAGHGRRVTKYALLLANALQLSAREREQIEIGSRLHDIGKIGIRDSVLRKKGRLSTDEYRHMQSHAVKGAAIVATIPELAPILPIVRNHHERWDGAGYPDKLAGDEISLASRIVAVADSFDAMTSHRPYRAGLTIDEAFDQLKRGAGAQFDPECSRAFLSLRRRLVNQVPNHKRPHGGAVEIDAECIHA
jgi:HD-GYP domain-containing protein (c-di-GMP phosphodiesterase class II)